MADFKEIIRQTGIQKKHSTSQKEVRRRQICYKLRKLDIKESTQSVQNLKHISKDIKETARIEGDIEENVFLQYYGKLWNTTNTNELQLAHKSADHSDVSINFYELENILNLTKNWQNPNTR
jgi:hypothetical protein